MGKMGSICHFPRALPASIWGHCSQVLVFTSIWGTRKGVWQWHFSCCFSQYLGILGPPNTAKQGKTQNDKSTLFYPPTRASWEPWRLNPGPSTNNSTIEALCAGTNGPVVETEGAKGGRTAILIVKHSFHCNVSPCGRHCRGSRGSPTRWPKLRTRVRPTHVIVLWSFCCSPHTATNPQIRGPRTHPKSRNIPKTGRLRELFRKVRANFCLPPVRRVRKPTEIVQKNLFRWLFSCFGWIFLLWQIGGFCREVTRLEILFRLQWIVRIAKLWADQDLLICVLVLLEAATTITRSTNFRAHLQLLKEFATKQLRKIGTSWSS